MFRAVGVLVIFAFYKSLINCFPDLTPEAITVYRNPEFFENFYYKNDEKDETANETFQGKKTEESYRYPGETTRPSNSGNSPGFEVTYDNSPEFHHDPRDIIQGPFRPIRPKGPYGPVHNWENINEENATENSRENLEKISEKNLEENLEENIEKNSEDNFKRDSEENTEITPEDDFKRDSEENTEITPEDSNEFFGRNSYNKEENSEENVEENKRNSKEINTNRSSEEEKEENQRKAKQKKENYNINENSEEILSRSPASLVTPDEELEVKKEPKLLAQPFNPDRISDLSKSVYNQPYPFNTSNPILYDNWKHYNYPKIYNQEFINSDFVPLYSDEEPSSNVFDSDLNFKNSENEEDNHSFEKTDTKDMGADSKHIYKKLLRHKKLKPSILFKYHSHPKLKKLKLKLKKEKHNPSWFDQYPFNF